MTRNDPQTLETRITIQINVRGIPATKAGDFRTIFNDNFNSAWILTPVGSTDYRLTMKQSYALKLKDDTLTQTINTIDKKINGLGLSESSVQKRGGSNSEAEILVQLPGVDDPARVKQILQTQAMLELDEVKGGPFSSREEAQASNGRHPAARLADRPQPGAKWRTASEFYILAPDPGGDWPRYSRCQAAAERAERRAGKRRSS